MLISDSGPSNSASVFLDGATSNVGIGIHAPTAKLHVSGNSQIDGNLTLTGTGNITTSGNINSVVNITATGNITASGTITGSLVTATSDKRLKKDIRPIGQKADEILNLHGISFNWIDSKLGKGRQFGFIAQDVEKVFPELVYTNKNGIKSVAYQSLIPVLVETIRSQQTQIEKLLEHQAALESAICESNPKSKICSKRIADEY